jgi:hypothetical protein
MSGWQSYISRATGDGVAPHRVRVSPSPSADLTERVAHTLRAQGTEALAVVDTTTIEPVVEAIRVNRGQHGMTSRVRWLVSPNGRSLLIVHDPSGVEAEALPDGFVYVSELNDLILQRDSVWDVAPSPSWRSIAYGQAFTFAVPEGAGDSVTTAMWGAVAAASGMPEDSVRSYSFLISGMATIMSYSRPVVVHLDVVDSATGKVVAVEERLNVSGGWRVRWTNDTTQLALGDAPIMVQDDSPPRNWLTVERATGDVRGTVSQSRLIPVDWRLGPALDVSIPIDVDTPRTMRLERATITSAAGWIKRDGRVVGPGVALAATRDGRFIAALAPRANQREFESALEPVVYSVRQ